MKIKSDPLLHLKTKCGKVNLSCFCILQKRISTAPEAQLLAVAAIGGSAGALLGMQFFHHKIRKWKFRLGVPLILAAQLILWRVLQ